MTTETLFFQNKNIDGVNLEIIFHKDYSWIYNEDSYPVVSFKLTNCQGIETINFNHIDQHNDGLMISITEENDLCVLEATDMGGIVTKIICEKVKSEEHDYNKMEYVKLVKEILEQRDNAHERVTKD